jgi:hypothetical protein
VTPQPIFFDGATFPFRRVRFRQDKEREENFAATLNLKRYQQLMGHEAFWKIGAKFFSREKTGTAPTSTISPAPARIFSVSINSTSPRPRHELFDGRFQMSPRSTSRRSSVLPGESALFRFQ